MHIILNLFIIGVLLYLAELSPLNATIKKLIWVVGVVYAVLLVVQWLTGGSTLPLLYPR